MELIPYEHFERLRLSRFQRDASRITRLGNWEFMDILWLGEADGFTAFLRPEAIPHALDSIELDLVEFPSDLAHRVLEEIQLPVWSGMSRSEVEQLLGSPWRASQFVPDRLSLDFVVGSRWPYHVGCTIHLSRGLVHLSVVRKDHLSLPAA